MMSNKWSRLNLECKSVTLDKPMHLMNFLVYLLGPERAVRFIMSSEAAKCFITWTGQISSGLVHLLLSGDNVCKLVPCQEEEGGQHCICPEVLALSAEPGTGATQPLLPSMGLATSTYTMLASLFILGWQAELWMHLHSFQSNKFRCK